jgi:hypothetical protein
MSEYYSVEGKEPITKKDIKLLNLIIIVLCIIYKSCLYCFLNKLFIRICSFFKGIFQEKCYHYKSLMYGCL